MKFQTNKIARKNISPSLLLFPAKQKPRKNAKLAGFFQELLSIRNGQFLTGINFRAYVCCQPTLICLLAMASRGLISENLADLDRNSSRN